MNKKTSNIIIVILTLLVLILCGYIIYDKTILTKENPTNKTESNGQNKENEKPKSASKINKEKDWIYDAEYQYNIKAESYTTLGNNTYYAKDIVVPYININSESATKANTEIKKVFDSAIEIYNQGVEDKARFVSQCNYEKQTTSNILSSVLTFGWGAYDVVNPDYYTYNFNLETGEPISFKDAYKLAGFTSENINDKVKDAITKYLQKILDFTADNYPEGTSFETYNRISYENYLSSVNNKNIKYFFDDENNLNIIVIINIPAGVQNFNRVITLK